MSEETQIYQKIKKLGEGSYGKAILCQYKMDKSLVVVKCMDLTQMNLKEIQSVLAEAKILEYLKHDNIISFREVFKTKKGKLYIVMDYAEGGDLSQRISKQDEKITENIIEEWILQICSALNYIHEQGIIHRDIKAQNIFLTKDDQIKLGDFGIARILVTGQAAQTVIGTPNYLSPEVINHQQYTTKSDIWSLGVVLYELLFSKLPFKADNIGALAVQITAGKYHIPSHNYSRKIIQLLKNMLQMNPKLRPTASEIIDNLTEQKSFFNASCDSIKKIQRGSLNKLNETILHAADLNKSRLFYHRQRNKSSEDNKTKGEINRERASVNSQPQKKINSYDKFIKNPNRIIIDLQKFPKLCISNKQIKKINNCIIDKNQIFCDMKNKISKNQSHFKDKTLNDQRIKIIDNSNSPQENYNQVGILDTKKRVVNIQMKIIQKLQKKQEEQHLRHLNLNIKRYEGEQQESELDYYISNLYTRRNNRKKLENYSVDSNNKDSTANSSRI